jgi:hypothetical protein
MRWNRGLTLPAEARDVLPLHPRERIRQIESKTMSKLRHPSRSQVLRDYLD